MHTATEATITSFIQVSGELPAPSETGYTARFNLLTATGTVAAPVNLALQRFTLTLDEHYSLTASEQAFFKQSYGVEVLEAMPLSRMSLLTTFMQCTGLHAEQVEMLLSQRTHAVRLSPNCPSKNPQHSGVTVPGITGKVLAFPHASHYGACYVNGTGTGADLYDDVTSPTLESKIRDQFDNSMGLVQIEQGDTKIWRLTKTSLDRLDRLQRMVRLQRWTDIPFPELDTLIICAIRAEGTNNLDMTLNENTLRALGVYRYLNQRHGIAPQEFAALMHDLTPYASGKAMPLFDQVFNRVQLFDTPLVLDQTVIDLAGTDPNPATQKTLLQLCAGLGLQPTEDSLLLIAKQTKQHLGTLKRDLPTVSSLFRQARIAQLFGYSVADLLTLAGLLGGQRYKALLASGQLSPRTAADTPDILDVLMQLDWAVVWLKDSQQSVARLQQRLGPNAPLATADDAEQLPVIGAFEYPPLADDMLTRLAKLHNDTVRSVVTEEQVAALGLPPSEDPPTNKKAKLDWFALLQNDLIDKNGLLTGLDDELTLVDEPHAWLLTGIEELLKTLKLTPAVKQSCAEKLVGLLLDAYDRQIQLLEGLFQETTKLAMDSTRAVIHWANASVYSILLAALDKEDTPPLIEHFLRVSQHAEIALHLRLSNSTLRVFLANPDWLGASSSNSEPSLSQFYLLERFSHWFHAQSQSEDRVLSYFSLANPPKAKLKNKALRQIASETANGALARLLEWNEKELAFLTGTLTEKRACSMEQVDWLRRCQAACQASGLSAEALLHATGLNDQSTLDNWKAVGDAVMAANGVASQPSLANA